ncbi:MAG: hypothetical protein EOR10_23500, partial [Mesorhizobium sp.]
MRWRPERHPRASGLKRLDTNDPVEHIRCATPALSTRWILRRLCLLGSNRAFPYQTKGSSFGMNRLFAYLIRFAVILIGYVVASLAASA